MAMVRGLSGTGPHARGTWSEGSVRMDTLHCWGHPVLRQRCPSLSTGLSRGGEGPILRIQTGFVTTKHAAFQPKPCHSPGSSNAHHPDRERTGAWGAREGKPHSGKRISEFTLASPVFSSITHEIR